MSVYLELRCDYCTTKMPGRVVNNVTAVQYTLTRMNVEAHDAGWKRHGQGKKRWECSTCIAAKTPGVINMNLARRK